MSRRLLSALVVLLALTGACGLSEDGGPQAIAPENLPPDLLDPNPGTSTTLAQNPGNELVSVYFIEADGDDVRLAEVERRVADDQDPGDLMAALLAQPTEEDAAAGITTTVPADTTLRALPLLNEETGELVIDLSSEFLSIEGPELAKAFAQMVWTVTEVDAVDRVRFLVDGEPIRAQNAEGAEKKDGPVMRRDYIILAPR